MVSTGSLRRYAARVAPSMAMIGPGMRSEMLGRPALLRPCRRRAMSRAGQGGKCCRQHFHPQPEFAGNLLDVQAEEVFDLGAGDQHGNAIGESEDHRARNKFHRRPMPVAPSTTSRTPAIMVHMNRPSRPWTAMIPATTTTNAPVGPPICVFDPPKQRDQKARDHGAINSGLRRETRCNRKCHRQRQRHQADGDSGNHIAAEFVEVVIAKAKNRLRQPAVIDGKRRNSQTYTCANYDSLDPLTIGTKGAARMRPATLRNTRHRFFQLDSRQRFCKSEYVSCWRVAALSRSEILHLDACFLTSLS